MAVTPTLAPPGPLAVYTKRVFERQVNSNPHKVNVALSIACRTSRPDLQLHQNEQCVLQLIAIAFYAFVLLTQKLLLCEFSFASCTSVSAHGIQYRYWVLKSCRSVKLLCSTHCRAIGRVRGDRCLRLCQTWQQQWMSQPPFANDMAADGFQSDICCVRVKSNFMHA
jgi:hypothetical protein